MCSGYARDFLLVLISGVGCAGSCEDSSDDEDFLTAFEEHERLLPKPAMTRVQQEQAAFVLHTSATPGVHNTNHQLDLALIVVVLSIRQRCNSLLESQF